MKLSTNLVVDSLQEVAEPAKKIDAMGFESLYISERKHEPFMQLAVGDRQNKPRFPHHRY